MAILVAVVLAGLAIVRGEQLRMVRCPPAVGFLILGFSSMTIAVLGTRMPENLIGGARFVELFFLGPVAIMIALRTRVDAFLVLGALVAVSIFEGVLGLVQFLTGSGAGISGQDVRAVGTFGAYNIGSLAEITGVGVVICLAVATVYAGRLRWAAGGTALFLVLPHLASFTRGAWVATVAAAVIVLSRGRPARLLATVAMALALATVILPPLAVSQSDVGQRVASLVAATSAPDQSVVDRLELWNAASRMALDHPLIGVGPRSFPEYRDAYAALALFGSSDISFESDFQQVELRSPHDLYLLIASEQGLVVLFIYLSVLATLFVRALVRATRRRRDFSTALALIGVGLLARELVTLLTADLGGPGSIMIALTLGIAGWAASDIDLDTRPDSYRDRPVKHPVGVEWPAPEEPQLVPPIGRPSVGGPA